MTLLICMYLLSVVLTVTINLHQLVSDRRLYQYSVGEQAIALLIIPIIPVFNLIYTFVPLSMLFVKQ